MTKFPINPDAGIGFPAFAGTSLRQLAHAEGVVVDFGSHRFVHCSGKTATDDEANTVDGRNQLVGEGDIGTQTRQVLKNIDRVLKLGGATLDDIYRMRVYVVAPMTSDDFAAIHRVRTDLFNRQHYPASTLVVVAGLARLGALIEIEAEAVVAAPGGGAPSQSHS
jgi:enamine deaminase RidA (YjgF/YER057c/UK114 family)